MHTPLQWSELADRQPGVGEIRVKVAACGVCRTDLHVIDGELPDIKLPVIPGHEIVGRIDAIGSGVFSPGETDRFLPIVQSLLDHGDHYFLLADYAQYVAAQERVDALYADADAWTATAIRNVAAMGPFSSDRTIREYADKIWGVRSLDL